MAANINTSKVKERRKLQFKSVDDALAELDRIGAAEKSGQLRQLGNWTPGQVFGHVAAWIDYAYEGFPLGPPPFFVRWFLRWRVKSYLRDGMPAGVWIPRVEKGTFGVELLTTEEGATRLRRSLKRLMDGEPVKFDSPAFGPMSVDDRIQLMLRHAELHMGFLAY